ncbi:hypothetical protein [Marinifilum flexuosum]|uniref:hypothetical protein n=1 Tax=Marinifilum flexuosum TaxID=1117708 RepID=UPI0024925449|nr:hypothetical protein [Marinifilum flexuosum]
MSANILDPFISKEFIWKEEFINLQYLSGLKKLTGYIAFSNFPLLSAIASLFLDIPALFFASLGFGIVLFGLPIKLAYVFSALLGLFSNTFGLDTANANLLTSGPALFSVNPVLFVAIPVGFINFYGGIGSS